MNSAVGDVDQARRCADLRLEDSEVVRVWTARPNHVFQSASGTSNARNDQARGNEFHMKAELPRAPPAVVVVVSHCLKEREKSRLTAPFEGLDKLLIVTQSPAFQKTRSG